MVLAPILPSFSIWNTARKILNKLSIARLPRTANVSRTIPGPSWAADVTGLSWSSDISGSIARLAGAADVRAVAGLTRPTDIARSIARLARPTDITWSISGLARPADITWSISGLAGTSHVGSSTARLSWQCGCDVSRVWTAAFAWSSRAWTVV
jgi:hypothetical protein